MSVISDSGVSSTVVRLREGSNYVFDLEISAVDGSLHDFFTEEGEKTYVVVATVFFRLRGSRLEYLGSRVKEIVSDGNGEDLMRTMEYEEANSLNGLILMDRKITMDMDLGLSIPRSVIGIVKDFDQRERNNLDIPNPPWLIISQDGPIRKGYVKLANHGWIFRVETNVDWNSEDVLSLLYAMSREPIPEALGYNYPIFLADKMAKFYRDRAKRTLDFLTSKELVRYRTFRSLVEGRRRSWNLNR
ncbi:MAG: DNA double-strand break repair nuclease NurA [Metallosphaera sp.]|uniref:DNA double-strand break repair nuclease NurA n=1 Tax=Metallosphaera sp. TaxID=2020860 RepID=UPI0031723C86